jgi:xanthosine utilization system XapX-like protein
MKFTVPQFIERETPIVGPLTFKQLVFVGTSAIFCLILYFVITNLVLFILASILILGAGVVLAFLKIGGLSAPTILLNLLKFKVSPKIYIWKKEQLKKEPYEKSIELDKKIPIKITQKSQLKKLQTKTETRIK